MLDHLSLYRRRLNFAGFAICALLVAAAYYLQFVGGLEPCPLCIFQRIALAALGVVFLLTALQNPSSYGRYVYSLFILVLALGGAGVAGRHVWLQSLPEDQIPACGPGLNYLLDTCPLFDAVALVLRGSGECAEIERWLGLSIPMWTLLAFIGLGVAGLLINLAGVGRRRTG